MIRLVIKKSLPCLYAATICLPCLIGAQPLIIEYAYGENSYLEIESNDSFESVLNVINENIAASEANQGLEIPLPIREYYLSVTDKAILVRAAKSQTTTRTYALPSESQKQDISYIVTTLTNSNLLKIKKSESSLKKAGDRIDQVHPLQFLGYVFSTEELKVCMRNLQGRSWVWKEFLSGLINSLKEESARDNVQPFVEDFASRIKLNSVVFLPTLNAGQWDDFINVLIKNVPREGNAGRYDM